MAEFSYFSFYLVDDSDFQMESPARFPEKEDASDLLRWGGIIRTGILKEAQKSVFDPWHAERSEARKLEEIAQREL